MFTFQFKMFFMMSKRLFFIGILFLFSHFSCANIGVSPIVIDLMPDNPHDAEIAVKNFDLKHKAYVEINSYRLEQPGDPSAKKIRVRNPQQEGLVVFPAKLILLPGQTQYVRIVKTIQQTEHEKVFEVDFIPKVTNQIIQTKLPNGPVMGIRVLVGYGARITLRPKRMQPALAISRKDKQLFIQNKGNTQLKIVSCSQTISGKKTEVQLPAYTLFVGKTISQHLHHSAPIRLEVYVGDKAYGVFHTK